MGIGTEALKITGTIEFPCCKKQKKVLYGHPSGIVSDICPRCRKPAMFDLDNRVSWSTTPADGNKIHQLNR